MTTAMTLFVLACIAAGSALYQRKHGRFAVRTGLIVTLWAVGLLGFALSLAAIVIG